MAIKMCGLCHKAAEKMKVCSGCHLTPYCSRECQTKDWAAHKVVCKPEPERREDAKATHVAFSKVAQKASSHIDEEYRRKVEQLQRLDDELAALIKDHPDRDDLEQMFYQTITGAKADKQLARKK